MKAFVDFLPLVFFFLVFKMEPRILLLFGREIEVGGIYSATAVLIVSSVVVYGVLWAKHRTLTKGQWLTLGACLVFGSLTLAFHSDTFLKWKTPVVNWILAAVFFGSHFVGDKPIAQRLLASQPIELPARIWARLNAAWVVFFLFCGAANLFVAFTFEKLWVDFKVFGTLGMTLLFMIGQGLYIAKHGTQTDAKPQA